MTSAPPLSAVVFVCPIDVVVSEDTGIKISDFLFSEGIRTTALLAKKLALKQEPNQFFLIKFGDFSIKNYELFWSFILYI